MPFLKSEPTIPIIPVTPVLNELLSIFRIAIIGSKVPLNILCIKIPLALQINFPKRLDDTKTPMTFQPLQFLLQFIKVVQHLLNKLNNLLSQVHIPVNTVLLILFLHLGLPGPLLKYLLPRAAQNRKKLIKINPIITYSCAGPLISCPHGLFKPPKNSLNMDLARLQPHAIKNYAQILDGQVSFSEG